MKPASDSYLVDSGRLNAERPPAGADVRVTAGSRLHFGLMGFRHSDRPYGGVGMMIDEPANVVCLEPQPQSQRGEADDATFRRLLSSWASYHQRPEPIGCRITFVRRAPAHVGLGSGTQTALSLARALNAHYGIDKNTPQQLAHSVHRARRSSVGSWGFCLGGCVVELGQRIPGQLAPDCRRADVPDDWRVLLIWPAGRAGLHGVAEDAAFAALSPIPARITARLEQLALESLLPALQSADFSAFSQSLYEYGLLSGSCFASVQGGAFASSQSAALVGAVRAMGGVGVGQSSWGPLVFAVLPDDAQASWLRQRLQAEPAAEGLLLSVARPKNHGAEVEREPPILRPAAGHEPPVSEPSPGRPTRV